MSSSKESDRPASERMSPIPHDYFKNHEIESEIADLRGAYRGYEAFEIELKSGIVIGLPSFWKHEFEQLAKGDKVVLSSYGHDISAANLVVSRDNKDRVKLTIGFRSVYEPRASKSKK